MPEGPTGPSAGARIESEPSEIQGSRPRMASNTLALDRASQATTPFPPTTTRLDANEKELARSDQATSYRTRHAILVPAYRAGRFAGHHRSRLFSRAGTDGFTFAAPFHAGAMSSHLGDRPYPGWACRVSRRAQNQPVTLLHRSITGPGDRQFPNGRRLHQQNGQVELQHINFLSAITAGYRLHSAASAEETLFSSSHSCQRYVASLSSCRRMFGKHGRCSSSAAARLHHTLRGTTIWLLVFGLIAIALRSSSFIFVSTVISRHGEGSL